MLTSPEVQSTDILNTQVRGDLLSGSSIQWCKRKRWQCARWLRCAAWVPCSRCSPPGRSAPRWFCVGCCPGWWELWQCRRSFGQAAPFLQPQKKWRPDSNHLRYGQFTVCHNTTQEGNGNNLYRQGNVKLAHKGSMERLTGKNRHLYQQQIQETNMLLKFTLGLRERWLDRKSASPPSLMTSVQSPGMTGWKGKTLLLGVLWPSHTHHDILCTQTQNKCWFCGFCFLC